MNPLIPLLLCLGSLTLHATAAATDATASTTASSTAAATSDTRPAAPASASQPDTPAASATPTAVFPEAVAPAAPTAHPVPTASAVSAAPATPMPASGTAAVLSPATHTAAAAPAPATASTARRQQRGQRIQLDDYIARAGARYTDAARCHIVLPSAPHETDPLPMYLIAARHNSPPAVRAHFFKWLNEAFSRRRCALEERNTRGLTPLLFAVLLNDAELADYLLRRGANPYARVMGNRPAISGRHAFDLLELLQQQDGRLTDRSAMAATLERYRKESS